MRAARIAVLALAASLALALPSAAPASPAQESVFMDDPRLVFATPEELEATLRVLRGLGADRLRVSVFWGVVAPDRDGARRPAFNGRSPADPAGYPAGSWDRYDRIVTGAARHGLRVHFNVTGPGPLWATAEPGRGEPMRYPSPGEFREFVTALGRRYSGSYVDERPSPPPRGGGGGGGGGVPLPLPGGQRATVAQAEGDSAVLPRVDFWSTWNEPNQPGWLRPQVVRSGRSTIPASPRIYRELQDAAYGALQATGHGGDTYLLAETAPRGATRLTPVSPMRPLVFIRELYCLDARMRPYSGRRAAARGCPTDRAGRRRFASQHPGLFAASGWAHHPYALEVAPGSPETARDQVTLGTLGRLPRTLDRAFRRYGQRRRLPVWITEYGYQTSPPDPILGIPWKRQADYLAQAEEIAYRNRRVRSLAQFLLVDDGPNQKVPRSSPRYWGSTFQSGLLTREGRAKDSFTSYQRTINVSPRRPRRRGLVRVFGQLRPAADNADLRATIEFRRLGSRRWKPVRRVRVRNLRNYLVARVRAGSAGDWRIAWRQPGAATVRSRAVRVRPR